MTHKALSLSVFLITGLVVYLLIQVFGMQSFNVMQIKGSFAEGTQIYFSNSNGFHPIIKKTAVGRTVGATADSQALNFQLSNRLVSRFQVDIAHSKLPFELEEISLHSHFAKQAIVWRGPDIKKGFEETSYRQGAITSYTLENPVRGQDAFIEYIIPVLVGLLMYLTVGRTNWSVFPPVQDLKNTSEIRDQNNFATLDGVRGLAALLVLMHHATLTFKGYGGLGVWIFFVLSGFLLTKSFVINPAAANRLPALKEFLTRRFRRIVPMYFLMITCIFLVKYEFDTAIRHYLFVQGDGHYWTILQEMYFYLLLPVLTLGSYLLLRGKILPTIFVLLIMALAWNEYASPDFFSIYGLNQPLRGYFQVFLLGMIGAYWYHGIYAKNQKMQTLFIQYQWLLTVIALLTLAVVLEISRLSNWSGISLASNKEPLLMGTICLFLILFAVTGDSNCIYKKLLGNTLIRYVGIIGYSFYLIHPYSIFMIRHAIEHFFSVPYANVNEFWHLGASFVLTLILASITYTLVERPFLRKAH